MAIVRDQHFERKEEKIGWLARNDLNEIEADCERFLFCVCDSFRATITLWRANGNNASGQTLAEEVNSAY